MPLTRSDRRLLLLTAGALVLAAVFFAGVLWAATLRSSAEDGPLYLGTRPALTEHIAESSPLYFANPAAGDGFWLDLEDGRLVALVLDRPGDQDCVVKWKEQRDAYVDCNGAALASTDLDRYEILIGPRDGSPRNSVYVDLRDTSPAPGAATAG